MPRDSSSDSRDRSRHRGKRFYRDSSSSPQHHRKHRNEKYHKQKSPSPVQLKLAYDLKQKSDIKNHFRYDNIRVYSQKEAEDTMRQVRQVLSQQFGPVAQTTKLSKEESLLSFGIGFKYDEDALQFAKKGGFISTEHSRHKLIHTATPVFEQCIPMIKDAIKSRKARYSAASPPNKSAASVQKVHKKRYSSESSDSRRKSKQPPSSHQHKKRSEVCLWIFGLPYHIKGKEVGDYLYYKHNAGPFEVVEWKWIRLKDSNCQFMEVLMDSRKAQKLLKLCITEQLMILGSPCIIVEAQREVTQASLKHCLKNYQFKITFPENINPANLYSFLRTHSRVIQMVSCNRLQNGLSDSYTVTLASQSKVRDMKRLTFRKDEIRIDDTRGQIVYRPTKQSRLTDNE